MKRGGALWAWVGAICLVVGLATAAIQHVEADLAWALPWGPVLPAIAMFAVQLLPIHIVTASGRHTVVLTEVVLAVGLFVVEPTWLVAGMMLGAAPAVARLRPSPVKFAVNLLQTGLWTSLPALFFHGALGRVEVTTETVELGFVAALLAFVGDSASIRVPIGIATGDWGVERSEARSIGSAAVIVLGATSLALLGMVVGQSSWTLLLLLVLPVAQLLLSTVQQARGLDRRAALDFTVRAAQELRAAEDVGSTLVDLLPGLREAFSVDQALLLLDVKGNEAAATVTEDGMRDSVVVGEALRRWLRLRAQDGPTTLRRDQSLVELAELLDVPELLMAPVSVSRGVGAILLAGRPLGDFRGDHVELMRTWVSAAASALERELIAGDLDAAKSRGEELERRASHDQLTSLANRALFEQELGTTIQSGQRCSVLFVDLDGFKAVNDTWGHAAGDAVLVEAAARINAMVRGSDVAARLGGDEFAVLVRGRGAQDAAAIGQRVLEEFALPVEDAPGVRGIRAAIGVAEVQPGEGAADLLRRADEAMYAAKRSGGNRVELGV